MSPANGGDDTGATTFPLDAAVPTTTEWQLLNGVEVHVPTATAAVATFGDSITDGYQSTIDTNRRWPNFLAQRLLANGQPVGVVDQGISGNRVPNDPFGPNGDTGEPFSAALRRNLSFQAVQPKPPKFAPLYRGGGRFSGQRTVARTGAAAPGRGSLVPCTG